MIAGDDSCCRSWERRPAPKLPQACTHRLFFSIAAPLAIVQPIGKPDRSRNQLTPVHWHVLPVKDLSHSGSCHPSRWRVDSSPGVLRRGLLPILDVCKDRNGSRAGPLAFSRKRGVYCAFRGLQSCQSDTHRTQRRSQVFVVVGVSPPVGDRYGGKIRDPRSGTGRLKCKLGPAMKNRIIEAMMRCMRWIFSVSVPDDWRAAFAVNKRRRNQEMIVGLDIRDSPVRCGSCGTMKICPRFPARKPKRRGRWPQGR